MDPLIISRELIIPGDILSVSYTRDLGAEGTAEVARQTPTTVELRLDARRCEVFDDPGRERVLAHPALHADRRGIVLVRVDEFSSRRKNLAAAREQLAACLLEALEASSPEALLPPPPESRPRRGRAGLFKPGRESG